jgi:hypothetical protein
MKVSLENVHLLCNEKFFSKDECLNTLSLFGPVVRRALVSGYLFDEGIKENKLIISVWKNVLLRTDFHESELLEHAVKSNSSEVLKMIIADRRVCFKEAYNLCLNYDYVWGALFLRNDLPIETAMEITFGGKRRTDLFESLFSKNSFKELSSVKAFAFAEKLDDFVLWRKVFDNHKNHLFVINPELALCYARKIDTVESWCIVLGRLDINIETALNLTDKLTDIGGLVAFTVLNRKDLKLEDCIKFAKEWDYRRPETLMELLKRPDIFSWLKN